MAEDLGSGHMRVFRHPVLGDLPPAREVVIHVNGQPLAARAGEPIAAALYAGGFRVLRRAERSGTARGIYCGIGQCTDCAVTVDGVPGVRSCVTPVVNGMNIRTENTAGGPRGG